MTSSEDVPEVPSGIARRQLLRAGAWAAPVVLVAAAVPASVASPIEDVFGDYFTWQDGSPSPLWVPPGASTYGQVFVNYTALTLVKSGTHTGTITMSISPEGGSSWKPEWNQPPREPGYETVPFTAPLPNTSLAIALNMLPEGVAPQPGSYTITLTFIFDIDGGSPVTVSYPIGFTVP